MFEKEAEEYLKVLCETCTFDTCRNNILHTCAIKESIKQAFLAGAELREERIVELEKQLLKSVYLMRELLINIDTPAYGYAESQAHKFIKEIKEK